MKALLIGTHNRHKAKEIGMLLAGLPFKVKCLADFPDVKPVVENGRTLEANAAKKARAYARATGLPTLADDTGLEVAALGGRPGVYSARYAGGGCSYDDNNRKLLKALAGKKSRAARFRCVVACAGPEGNGVQTAEGVLRGRILNELRGRNGFGYDPLFYLPGIKKTLAELSTREKNRLSHRARAVRKARKVLKKYA